MVAGRAAGNYRLAACAPETTRYRRFAPLPSEHRFRHDLSVIKTAQTKTPADAAVSEGMDGADSA